jgi:fatty acid desaturase
MASMLNDPRDAALLAFVRRATALVPVAIALFVVPRWAPWTFWGLAALFAAIYVGNLEQFITAYHDLNHRPLFARRYAALNRAINLVLGPLYGSPPHSYFIHHVLMHHPTNNLDPDTSSTLPYRRDSAVEYAVYHLEFFWAQVAVLRFVRGRYPGRLRLQAQLVAGELGYLGLIALGLAVAPAPTLVVGVFPLVVTRSLLAIGNWAEHAFVDPVDPGNLYRSSTTIIGDGVNSRSFNVGYHIGHHIRPGAHYTSQPGYFEQDKARYGAEDAIVLHELTYPALWWLLITHQYGAIADRFVRLPGAPERDRDAVIALLKSRVVPIGSAS